MISKEPAKALTIAGSDSGGAAGLQADLKTWTALGVYGMSVVTAVTAQNSLRVSGVQFLSPEFVNAQIDAVLSDYGAQVIKTGFIGEKGIVAGLAQTVTNYDSFHLVVDPVLVNHLGQFMFREELLHAYRDHLLPKADLITPNQYEASLLADTAVLGTGALKHIVEKLHTLGTPQVLITGYAEGDQIVDYWSDGSQLRRLPNPRLETSNRHGSGDTLSAAICAYLVKGDPMGDAIIKAQHFTAKAMRSASTWRLGHGHGPLSHLSKE